MSHVFPRHTRSLPPVVARGEGVYLYDTTGKAYLDGSGGAAVSCLGHGDAKVVAAMKAQLDTVAFAHTGFFSSEPAERLAEEFKAVGFYLSGHPLDDYMASLKRKDVMTLDEVMAKAERSPCVAKLAGVVAGRQERKSARGNRFAFCQLSDTTGAYEVTLFSETLEKSREHLETGAKVVVTVEATMESDQLKLLGRSVAPIDAAVADAGTIGLKVFVEEPGAIPSVATILSEAAGKVQKAARGPIFLYLMDPALPGEVETRVREVRIVAFSDATHRAVLARLEHG